METGKLKKELAKRQIRDVLTDSEGKRITDIAGWERHREEMLTYFQTEMYGRIPPKPKRISFTEESCDEVFCAGKAPLKKLMIHTELENGDFSFPVCSVVPVKKPRISYILINFRDNVPDRYLPSEELVDKGCAVFSFCYEDITSDDNDFTNGLAGLLFPEGRNTPDASGKLAMWAWAAMRVMDYVESLKEVDPARVTVIGHSRLGKTALLAGAFDRRFMAAASNDSGCAGAKLERGGTGEMFPRIFKNFPFWFCPAFAQYASGEKQMRYDQHCLLAAIAPRKVCVGSAEEDVWADPRSEFLACAAASGVYELYGLRGLVHEDTYPEAPAHLKEGQICYHIRKGMHYMSREDWLEYLKDSCSHIRTDR